MRACDNALVPETKKAMRGQMVISAIEYKVVGDKLVVQMICIANLVLPFIPLWAPRANFESHVAAHPDGVLTDCKKEIPSSSSGKSQLKWECCAECFCVILQSVGG